MPLLDSRSVLLNLWTSRGIDLPSRILDNVTLKLPSGLQGENERELKNGEQSLKSTFRIGIASQVTISAVTIATSFLSELRKEIKSRESERRIHRSQSVADDAENEGADLEKQLQQVIDICAQRIPTITVSARHSALEFASEKYTRVFKENLRSSSSSSTAPKAVPSENQSESIHYLDPRAKKILGIPEDAVGDWDSLAGVYEAKPQGTKREFVRLHTNFPHHKRGLLNILGFSEPSTYSTAVEKSLEQQAKAEKPVTQLTKAEKSVTRAMVQQRLKLWDPLEFETKARERGLCATMMRNEEEWESSEMGKSVRKCVEEWGGPVLIEKLSGETSTTSSQSEVKRQDPSEMTLQDSTIEHRGSKYLESGFGEPDRPLRVVDLSRVIAGPVGARVLAAHGASVLLLSLPSNSHLPLLEIDTARGKRAAYLDLDEADDIQRFRDLVRDGDVVLQAYRPSGLSSRGLSAESLQKDRPGLIYANLSAYGPTGPWSQDRGFDSLTQTACGMNHSESLSFEAFKRSVGVEELETDIQIEPKAMPVQALDHSAGYLLAFGILSAKIHQSLLELKDLLSGRSASLGTESSKIGFKVTLSLATTATWLKDLGRVNGKEAWEFPEVVDPQSEEVRNLLEPTRLRGNDGVWLFGMQHSGKIQGRRVGWEESPRGLGGDKTEWD